MDKTTVFFKCLEKGIEVSSILAEFTIFGRTFTIHWYGAIIAFGFVLAAVLGGRIAYTWKMSIDKMIDVLIYGTVAGILGARLYYVFSKWDYYGANPGDIFKIWEGGLAIYGGVIGGVIAAIIVCKKEKLNFFNLLDCMSISFLLGQGIGRWGNFANQEAFGTNTDLPWGMKSEKTVDYILLHYEEITGKGIKINAFEYVHPTFLYESIWCLLGVLVLYLLCRKFRLFSGQMALAYGVWYGAERAVVEGLRTDSLYIAGTTLRTSQVLSAVLAVVCLILLVTLTIKYKKNPKPIDGIDFYSDNTFKTVKGKTPEGIECTTEDKETEEKEAADKENDASDDKSDD